MIVAKRLITLSALAIAVSPGAGGVGASCASFPGFVFWPGYDSGDNDFPGPPDDPSKVPLATMIAKCSTTTNCAGLNTNGYFKTKIKALRFWVDWPMPTSSCQGLYIKSPTALMVNGNNLRTNEKTNLKWIAKWTVPYFGGGMDRKKAIQNYIAAGTWWSLREGVLNVDPKTVHGLSNCNAAVNHIGPVTPCPRKTVWTWQVGIAAVQVPNLLRPTNRTKLVEDRALSVYKFDNLDIRGVLGRAAATAGFAPGTKTHTDILASKGDLRVSWLLRSHLVGFYFVADEANLECLISKPKTWCYNTGNPYAPTTSSIRGAVDDVMVLLQSLTDGTGAT